MREARDKKAPKAMEGATQELERRSQYLSSLIQRTKVKSDDATPAGCHQNQRHVKKDTELPSLQRVRRQERRHVELPHQRQQQQQQQQQQSPPQPQPQPQPHLLRQDTKKKCGDYDEDDGDLQEELRNVRIRAADMPAALQKRAFRCAREMLAAMPKLDSKRLALALKKCSVEKELTLLFFKASYDKRPFFEPFKMVAMDSVDESLLSSKLTVPNRFPKQSLKASSVSFPLRVTQ